MNKLYIALLVHKRKIEEGRFICDGVGPIVGVLLGTHFLSSHSKHYIPMIKNKVHFEQDEFYLENYSFEQDEFFSSDFEYGYYELQEVTDYLQLESMILDYKKKFDKVSYFIDFARMTPTIIRYKRI